MNAQEMRAVKDQPHPLDLLKKAHLLQKEIHEDLRNSISHFGKPNAAGQITAAQIAQYLSSNKNPSLNSDLKERDVDVKALIDYLKKNKTTTYSPYIEAHNLIKNDARFNFDFLIKLDEKWGAY